MKQLFFACSFGLAAFLAYGVADNPKDFANGGTATNLRSYEDTLPGKKKDSLHKQKNFPLKDSTMRKDSLHPGKDTTIQQ